MFALLPDDNTKTELINRLATSESPFALRLLEEMVENETDASIIAYAQQAIPSVKEHIFDAFKEARALEKAKLKKEFSKLESSAVQEHIDILLELAAYQRMTGQLYPAKKHFARAYALNPQIISKPDIQDLAYQLFAQETGDMESELEAYLKLQNKHDRILEAKYPWFAYLFDFAVYGSWIFVVLMGIATYFEIVEKYRSRCGGRSCIDLWRAFGDNFAQIAPEVPRELIAVIIIAILFLSFIRIMMYIRQQNAGQGADWLEEARGNVFEDIEDELLKVFTPRKKRK